MLRFDRILFPVDFSSRCGVAAIHAAGLARRFGSEVTALHVAPGSEQTGRGLEDLRAFLPPELGGLRVQPSVLRGDPAAEILRAGDEADLIVLPTYGDGRLRRLLLGSVAARVLRDARCPVWSVVPDTCTFPEKPSGVLCAAPLSEETPEVLGFARAVAGAFGLPLVVVHAAAAIDAVDSARALLSQWVLPGEELVVEFGNVERIVRHEVERRSPAAMITGRGRTPGWLGADAYALIREARCPVLSASIATRAVMRQAA